MDPAFGGTVDLFSEIHHGNQLNEPINIYINSYKNNNMSFAFNENWCTKIKNAQYWFCEFKCYWK